jgi:divalent metal cation (Fe/Co/Zn/Cd) transporter
MNKIYFIIIFVLLFVISGIVIFNNNNQLVEAFDDSNKDKIKTTAQSIIKEVSKKAEETTSVVVDKVQEIAGSVSEVVKEKGGEAVGAMIVEPSVEVARDLVKKVLSSASSFLTTEDIEEILSNNENNNCNCK